MLFRFQKLLIVSKSMKNFMLNCSKMDRLYLCLPGFALDKMQNLPAKRVLQNCIPSIKKYVEKFARVLEEAHTLKYQTHPMYSTNLIHYALSLRYSSLSAYKLILEEFKLPSISF